MRGPRRLSLVLDMVILSHHKLHGLNSMLVGLLRRYCLSRYWQVLIRLDGFVAKFVLVTCQSWTIGFLQVGTQMRMDPAFPLVKVAYQVSSTLCARSAVDIVVRISTQSVEDGPLIGPRFNVTSRCYRAGLVTPLLVLFLVRPCCVVYSFFVQVIGGGVVVLSCNGQCARAIDNNHKSSDLVD